MCLSPITIKTKPSLEPVYGAYMSVPCGKCIECWQRKRTSWGLRLQDEQRVSGSSWFITLTYDDDHAWSQCGMMLKKQDAQNWLKRLRKQFAPREIRYFLCGEYGGKFGRPHYHAIIFCKTAWTFKEFDDKLKPTWTFGIYSLSVCNNARTMYATKYMLKEFEGELNHSFVGDEQRPFNLMSKGLGIENQLKNKQYYEQRKTNTVTTNTGYSVAMPRYYREKLYEDAAGKVAYKARENYLLASDRAVQDWIRCNPGSCEHDYYKYKAEALQQKIRKTEKRLKSKLL